MLPQAGTVLVKVESVNKVYVLDEVGGVSTLRWISSEDLAEELYGADWADYVIDVPVTAWSHFGIGDDVEDEGDGTVDRDALRTREALNAMKV